MTPSQIAENLGVSEKGVGNILKEISSRTEAPIIDSKFARSSKFGNIDSTSEAAADASSTTSASNPSNPGTHENSRLPSLEAGRSVSDGQPGDYAADSPGDVFGTTYTAIKPSELPEWGRQALRAAEREEFRSTGKRDNVVAVQLSGSQGIQGQTGSVGFFKAFLNIFGKKVRFVKGADGEALSFDGLLSPEEPNTFIIDADAPSGTAYLFGHELGHSIQHQRPELYDAFMREILTLAGDRSAYTKRLEALGYKGESLDVEFVNDFIGSQMVEPKFWEKLRAQNSGVFKQVVGAALDYLKAIGGKINNLHRDVRPHFNDIEQARASLVTMLETYQRGEMPGTSVRRSALEEAPDADLSISKPGGETDPPPAALAKMPPVYRDVFNATRNGMTPPQISEKLGISEKGVGNILKEIQAAAARTVESGGVSKSMENGLQSGKPDPALTPGDSGATQNARVDDILSLASGQSTSAKGLSDADRQVILSERGDTVRLDNDTYTHQLYGSTTSNEQRGQANREIHTQEILRHRAGSLFARSEEVLGRLRRDHHGAEAFFGSPERTQTREASLAQIAAVTTGRKQLISRDLPNHRREDHWQIPRAFLRALTQEELGN